MIILQKKFLYVYLNWHGKSEFSWFEPSDLSLDFCWLRSENQVKFTEECRMYDEECFSKKKQCLQMD